MPTNNTSSPVYVISVSDEETLALTPEFKIKEDAVAELPLLQQSYEANLFIKSVGPKESYEMAPMGVERS